MKYLLLAAILMYGCGGASQGHVHGESCSHEAEVTESHEGHNHAEGESHEGHNHAVGESHEGHNHAVGESHEGHNHAEGESHAEVEAAAHSDEIIVPVAQAERVGIKTTKVEPKDFYDIQRVSGEILPSVGSEVVLSAPISGIVTFASSKVAQAADVSTSQALFYISSKDIAEGDYMLKASALYAQSKSEYERATELVKDSIISRREYQAVELAYKNAKIAYDAIAGKSGDAGVAVRSNIGGFVKNLTVKNGDYVSVGMPLATIAQNKRLTMRAEVPMSSANKIATVASANFKTPYNNKIYSLDEMNGRKISYGKSTDGSSQYLPILFDFDNNGDIVSGSYVEVFLKGAVRKGVITVPLSSLMEEQGGYYLFVKIDEEGYLRKDVVIGGSDGNYVEISSGVVAGEDVVSGGAYQVKMASMSTAIPHGHAH